MKASRFSILPLTFVIFFLTISCSNQNSSADPLNFNEFSSQIQTSSSNRVLWGLWHINLDPVSMTAEVVPVRGAMFTCNVTRFMQPPASPTNLVSISIESGSEPAKGLFVVNVSLRHPFVGLNFYNGFDVRGIFMSDGSLTGVHDPSVVRASHGDSILLNADGYTRFWNPMEFTSFETIFGFTKGKLAPANMPTSTVNPYKYFADGLGISDPIENFDTVNRGIFRAGSVNIRQYVIQFKMSGGAPVFDFNYAVDASWSKPDDAYAPEYPPEAFDISANVQEPFYLVATDAGSTAYFVDPSKKGGVFKFDLEIFDRQGNVNPNGVPGEISAIWVESNALTGPVDVLSSATVKPGTKDISAIFQIELSNVNLTASGQVQFFVTVESSNPTSYEPAVPGGSAFAYPDAPLAGYFLFTGNVLNTAPPDDWPTEPVLIDPNHPVVGTHFAIDKNEVIHALYQNENGVYWSYSDNKGLSWVNKGLIYSPSSGKYMFRNEIGMTSDPTHVYCVLSEWDGQYGTTFCGLTVGRLNASNIGAGWEFKSLWQNTGGYSAEQCYSGLQIAVDNSGNIMIYAMLYNFASFVSKYCYVPNWDALTGAQELTISPENGTLVYYYPQPTVGLVADSLGNFFFVAGGNFNDYSNYNGYTHDYGCFMLRYTPSTGKWRFVQSISHPLPTGLYWNSWAAGVAVGADDKLYWVNGYQRDNCGYYGLQGGYFLLSYGTGQSTGDHDFYFNDPINETHNNYVDCDLTYEYYGYDLMYVSSSIGVDPAGNVVITYQRSRNYSHLMAIRNDGLGWSDPPVQIDGGLMAENPYGRMHPSGWFLITFTDTNYKGEGSKLPYFVAWK